MIGQGTLKVGGVNLKTEFGIMLTGTGVFSAPSQEVNKIGIVGRNGDILQSGDRFPNITVTYPAIMFSFDESSFVQRLDDLRNFLASRQGYQRLEDSYHPDEYRMGAFLNGFEPSVSGSRTAGSVALSFDCMPQRYLIVGEYTQEFTADGSIFNPTYYSSKPLIRVYGHGELSIGGNDIEIAQHSYAYTDIDCELMDCFYQLTNLNSYVTLDDFPVLNDGSNGIRIGTGITKVEITPRWWKL